ncbi:DNA internalization-related competence protein ComEC/Rec2 [Stenotrophomonas sp. SRS1]|uniref:DNA internalization-related competence protein ComEC/Rec2 n=1 Tax=Stenotrophomonas sp. SRS1 TaxID=2870345 RepID=UPI002238CB1A|nr:DNA internalization-related competence protein ComEC/Rec2 [Stenotrophomonas sp. SRS1]
MRRALHTGGMPAHASVPIFGKACAVALLAGICVIVFSPRLLPLGWGVAAAAFGIVSWILPGRFRLLGAVLFGIGWAAVHGHAGLAQQLPPGGPAVDHALHGRVISLPQHGPGGTRFLFRVDEGATMPTELRGRDLALGWYDGFRGAADDRRRTLRAGERWSLTVRVRPPRGRVNPGGFDAEGYALRQRVAGSGYVREPAQAHPLGEPTGLPAWRERMANAIARAIQGDGRRFVQALALGDTRGLSQADWDDLRALGVTHLVAISGFHVGVVAGVAALLAGGLWRCLPMLGLYVPRPMGAAAAAVAGAALYAAAAGFALPTVRTLLMIAVVATARCSRRRATVAQSLSLAALAMLLFDPLAVLAPGFWLSFAGVLWLIWCLPGREQGWLRGFLGAQGVATVALLPLTVALFGQASRAGPLVNLVAIPWWTMVVVPLALLGTALEALIDGAGRWPWQLAAWCFEASWWLFGFAARSELSLWWLPQSSRWALISALFGVFWLLLPRGSGGRVPALLLCLPLLWPARHGPAEGEVELLVMDVGQGLAVAVRTRRHTLLYDTGPGADDGFDAGERIVVPTLRALGQGRLDRIMISHDHRDHTGGLRGVRRSFPDALLQAPPDALRGRASACHAGQSWQWDGVTFRVLHPPRDEPQSINDSSCVLRLETSQGAILLAGDIEKRSEALLVQHHAALLAAEAVLVPHHGSASSSTPAWVAAVAPRLAIVSAGHRNRFGHPRAEVVARWQAIGAEVLSTADSGAVRVWLGREGLQVREQRVFERRWWDAAERSRPAAILSAIKQAAAGPED